MSEFDEPIELVNIDHHHDIEYADKDADKTDNEHDGNWVKTYFQQNKIAKYCWINNVNSTPLSATATSFVDSSILKPGKIYKYHVAACYNNGVTDYLTMNSNSSTVVWGIPQLPEEVLKDNGALVGSVFGAGSLAMLVAMIALGVAAASMGITLTLKKKNFSRVVEEPDEAKESEDEE
jgi:hypothetical protein